MVRLGQYVVVEGADRSGKTFFIKNHLQKYAVPHNLLVKKNVVYNTLWGGQPLCSMAAFNRVSTDSILNVLEACHGQHAVNFAFDRSWPSEWVYSRLLNRELSDDATHEFEHRFHKLGGHHVWCALSNHVEPDADLPVHLTADALNRAEALYNEFYRTVAVCPVHRIVDFGTVERFK